MLTEFDRDRIIYLTGGIPGELDRFFSIGAKKLDYSLYVSKFYAQYNAEEMKNDYKMKSIKFAPYCIIADASQRASLESDLEKRIRANVFAFVLAIPITFSPCSLYDKRLIHQQKINHINYLFAINQLTAELIYRIYQPFDGDELEVNFADALKRLKHSGTYYLSNYQEVTEYILKRFLSSLISKKLKKIEFIIKNASNEQIDVLVLENYFCMDFDGFLFADDVELKNSYFIYFSPTIIAANKHSANDYDFFFYKKADKNSVASLFCFQCTTLSSTPLKHLIRQKNQSESSKIVINRLKAKFSESKIKLYEIYIVNQIYWQLKGI